LPLGQAFPQVPQFDESVDKYAQAPLQFVAPAGQVAWQKPARQERPAAHGEAQVPEMQFWFAGQTVPQAPQLLGSFCRFVHVPPLPPHGQAVCGAEHVGRPGALHAPPVLRPPHVVRQTPSEQALPLGQAFPQVPQFEESVDTYTQALPQWTVAGPVPPPSAPPPASWSSPPSDWIPASATFVATVASNTEKCVV
jgi:hypothetical protein